MARRGFLFLIGFVAFSLIGCDQFFFGFPVFHTGNAESSGVTELINDLTSAGFEVEQTTSVSQDFFEVTRQGLLVNGDEMQVFEFASEAQAEANAAVISPDGGSTNTMMIMWMAPPHFFKSGNLIVIYLGTSQEILDALAAKMGEQFAGQ